MKRIAIVHDWLPLYGGAERVLEQMLQVFPQADLFSMIDLIPPEARGFLLNKPVRTSFIQRLPFARKHYRSYLALMPLAVEQFDLRGYDLVISNSYAVAKGVLTGPDQLHICYCCSPIRYAWDMQAQYLEEGGLTSGLKGMIAKTVLHYIRLWDSRTAAGVNHFLTLSRYIGRRIKKTYGRESTVIYPPVDIDKFQVGGSKEDFYFTASRMVPYKRIDLIVEAFSRMPGRRLIVLGDGPEMAKVRSKAGPNVQLLGYQDDEVMRDHMQRARAFVFAAEEDFGIVPVEAQACGTPVIAYGKGGVRETVLAGVTGVFFDEQTVEAVVRVVEEFEGKPGGFDAAKVRANAERFSPALFRAEFAEFVEAKWSEFAAAL
ncbi:MAG TPA: glycosyltransferase family 4 protein [Chthoniobacteraceae bacterium]|jgi:glycosyltransferase involved in cell wall biosynthesis|nr:glycosyltransferase family 4 protein [Chthoniobacteraceae bacterium]